MKKLTKTDMAQLELLIDRAQANGQPIPLYTHIQVGAEPAPSDTVSATLAERGNRYGDFTDHARVCQQLQDTLRNHNIDATTLCGQVYQKYMWLDLNNVQKQALTVICDKLARIISGDPNYADNWHDIQGYAKLVEDRLPKSE